jgi:AcrR family transcriptional regulator
MPRRPPGSDTTSVWLRPAGAARQARPAFSREVITRVAIDLADQKGLAAVSMRRVAACLGSAPTSLYWYFSDKSQLYELMVDAVVGEIELPERPSGDWRADLASIARAARAMGRRHPWLAQLAIPPVPGPLTRKYGTAAFRSLEGLGLDPATQVNILAAVNNYVSGFLQRETGRWTPTSRATAMTAQRETSPSDRAVQAIAEPSVTPQHLAARARMHSDESFAFGLDCLLDGIAAHIAQPANERPPARARRQHQGPGTAKKRKNQTGRSPG